MRKHQILATLAYCGLIAVAPAARADDASREADLSQRRAALDSDQKQQVEALASARARLQAVTKELAPIVRVCMTSQDAAALSPADVERAEKSAEAVYVQLRDAAAAAKACSAPDTLKKSHQALSDAIDQTAVIERLVTVISGGSDEVAGTRSKIPGSLATLEAFSQSWAGVEAGYKSFGARITAYQKDAEAFNSQLQPVKPPLTAPHADPIKIDTALQENFDGLAASVQKISEVRSQLSACRRSEAQDMSAELVGRVNAARRNAARAFATYGQRITHDSADCQTRLETNASPGDAPVLEAAMGKPSPESTEPPPPKAAPVAAVIEQAPPAPIPGSKIKPPAEKRTAKRTAPTITVAAVSTGGVKVTGVSGFASTQEGSNTFGLGEGQTVAAGAAVKTQLSSRVRLGGMAQTVDIGADTRVEVPTAPSNLLKLDNGTVDIKRTRGAIALADEPNFNGIETAQGVITDAGAHYRVIVAQGQTAVEVFDGTVHLAGSYVLKLAASDQPDAEKRTPTQELDLTSGERAIMLHVGEPANPPANAPATTTVIASAPTAATPAAPPAAAPAPQAVTAQAAHAPQTAAEKRREARRVAAAAAAAKTTPRIVAENSSAPRLPGFLTARAAEAVATPSIPASIPAFASIAADSSPSQQVAPSTQLTASAGADPVEQARVQLQTQRQQEEEKQRAAEQQRAEQQRAEQARIEEQRRVAEARETERFGDDQVSPVSSRIPAPFAGTWQCRVFPSQRGRYAAAPIQSQIIIRPTTRGFEAFAGGERLPSVSIQGTRIRFAQVVAGYDTGYYGAIDFDLLNGGATLSGTGRIRVSSGPYMQELPATLSCERSRY